MRGEVLAKVAVHIHAYEADTKNHSVSIPHNSGDRLLVSLRFGLPLHQFLEKSACPSLKHCARDLIRPSGALPMQVCQTQLVQCRHVGRLAWSQLVRRQTGVVQDAVEPIGRVGIVEASFGRPNARIKTAEQDCARGSLSMGLRT